MSDLLAFLRARLAEDEAATRAVDGMPGALTAFGAVAQFIASTSPARVLREVAAIRAILELHRGEPSAYAAAPAGLYCQQCGVDDGWYGVEWPCGTVLAVLAIWRDHPDYEPGWKP